MTKLIGTTLVIESQEPDTCEMCGNEAELRPYGPNGENVCFPCGMKDPEAAERQYKKLMAKATKIVNTRDGTIIYKE